MGEWKGDEGNQHRLTKGDSRKGGRTSSPAKAFAAAFRNRLYCDHKCPVYPCPYEPLCFKPEYVIKIRGRIRRKCVVRETMPADLQRRMIRIMQPSPKNFMRVLTELLTELTVEVAKDKNIESLERLIKNTVDIHDTFWGRKTRQEISGHLETKRVYTAEELRRKMKEIYGGEKREVPANNDGAGTQGNEV